MPDATAAHIKSTNTRLRSLEIIMLGWTKAVAVGLVIVGVLTPLASLDTGGAGSYSLLTLALAYPRADDVEGLPMFGGILLLLLGVVIGGTLSTLRLAVSGTSLRRAGRVRVALVTAAVATGILMVFLLISLLSLAQNDAEIFLAGPALVIAGVVVSLVAAFAPAYVAIWED